MLSVEAFRTLLETHGHLVIDGGLATELESRGHDLNHPLWSAKLLKDDPDVIEKVHLEYYLAGADIAISASYQGSIDGFRNHLGMSEAESKELIKRSVELARNAGEAALQRTVEPTARSTLVAGGIGPYGAFLSDGSEYHGDYKLTKEQLQNFHRPRIQALIDASVDLLALETMPQLLEIEALLELLRDEFPATIVWISCTLSDSGHISDGTCIEQVLRVVNQYQDVVVAFGANCVPLDLVTEALQLMKRRTKLPLLCYPNSGEVFHAETKTWMSGSSSKNEWPALVREWQENGARLIGGCCRTGPGHIKQISDTLLTKAENGAPKTG